MEPKVLANNAHANDIQMIGSCTDVTSFSCWVMPTLELKVVMLIGGGREELLRWGMSKLEELRF